MLIWNCSDSRMINPVKLAAIFSITRPVVGTADNESFLPERLPPIEKPSEFSIYVAECRAMAFDTILNRAFQIKIVRIMDGVNIDIEKNRDTGIRLFQLPQNEIHLVSGTVLHRTGEGLSLIHI